MSPKKMQDKYMNFLRSQNATQSAADVYADVEMKTGCSIRALLAMVIHEILFFWVPPSQVNGSWVELQLKTIEGDVIGGMTRREVIMLAEHMMRYQTNGSGSFTAPLIYKFDPPLLIVEPSLWFGIKSSTTAVINTGYCRIGFTWKTITQSEYVEALELMR